MQLLVRSARGEASWRKEPQLTEELHFCHSVDGRTSLFSFSWSLKMQGVRTVKEPMLSLLSACTMKPLLSKLFPRRLTDGAQIAIILLAEQETMMYKHISLKSKQQLNELMIFNGRTNWISNLKFLSALKVAYQTVKHFFCF